ncbi:NAD(P)-binding domain-containing protein [Micromonospora sp. NPDC005254]|uniref:NAD(P)-binding domain-containing protein n=1 Tax=Micromonospora sp. NPDC005254 TaxID=3364229 RepID=UPI0036CC3175
MPAMTSLSGTARRRGPTILWRVARGAVAVDSPAEAARRADLVITMLSDPAALREVVEGPQGVLAGATASTTLAEMSTVGPPAVRRLAAMLPDGVGLLDAPVLGSVSEAESCRPPSRQASNCRSRRPHGSGSRQPRRPALATGTTRP